MSARAYARVLVALLVGGVMLTATVQAQTTWYVDDDALNDPGPGDPSVSDPLEDGSAEHPFDAIQEGIDAAVDGDTVLVLDGTYTGTGNKNLDFAGKAITVRSETGPDNCTIDCEGDGRGAYFHSGENHDAVLESLTIQNGYVDPSSSGGPRGGGIFCHNSSPTISNCVVRENHAEGPTGGQGRGGGIACLECSPTIVRCWILDNTSNSMGGGIYCESDSSTISECTINNNAGSTGGGICCNDGTAAIIQCTITRNTAYFQPYVGGGGIYCLNGSSPTIIGCKIVANTAPHGGGGICAHYSSLLVSNCTIAGNASNFGGGVYCTHSSSLMLTNCIIWANSAPNGPQIAVMSRPWLPSILTVSYTDVQGGEADAYVDPDCTLNWGPGNIDADPLFVDPDNDYHLSAGSPCIDAGDNTAVPDWLLTDLDGNPRFVDDPDTDDTGNGVPPIVDMGAYEFQVGVVAYLDIKPGSCPNPLNRTSHGKLPVAIAGTAGFDVTQIDVDTLVLARADGVGGSVTPLIGPPGPGIHVEDVATPFDGEPCDCHELEGDGIDDLSMRFETELVVAELQLDDFTGGTFVELVLSGELSDGTPFSATDCIRLVPPGSGSANVAAGPDGGDGGLDARPGSQPPNSEEGHPTGGASGQDADRAPGDADANEESQDTFAVPLAACGALSPALSLATIVGVCVLRPRRP